MTTVVYISESLLAIPLTVPSVKTSGYLRVCVKMNWVDVLIFAGEGGYGFSDDLLCYLLFFCSQLLSGYLAPSECISHGRTGEMLQ